MKHINLVINKETRTFAVAKNNEKIHFKYIVCCNVYVAGKSAGRDYFSFEGWSKKMERLNKGFYEKFYYDNRNLYLCSRNERL